MYNKNILLIAIVIASLVNPIAFSNASNTLIWENDVFSNGSPVSSPTLTSGKTYLIQVNDFWWYDFANHLGADAMYYTTIPSWDGIWDDYLPCPDGHSFLQIDGQDVNWGPFDNGNLEGTGHTYSIQYIGSGTDIVFSIYDWVDGYTNNVCHMHIKIYETTQCYGFTIGYWKNHRDAWPVDEIEIGDQVLTQSQAITILRKANSKDATYMLSAQLIAAKLNYILNGAPTLVEDAIIEADAFLFNYPLGSNPRGSARDYALDLKDILDDYNNNLL